MVWTLNHFVTVTSNKTKMKLKYSIIIIIIIYYYYPSLCLSTDGRCFIKRIKKIIQINFSFLWVFFFFFQVTMDEVLPHA
jgi:hypothetical protein